MAKRSDAKSAKRSFMSNYLNIFFWREASLRAFCENQARQFRGNIFSPNMLINDFGVFAFEIAHLTKMKSAIVFERKFLARKMPVVGKFEAGFLVHVLLHFERARKWKLKRLIF